MNDQIVTVIVAIIAAMGSGVGVAFLTRRKTHAETQSTIVQTATQAAHELIAEYKDQADGYQAEITRLASQIIEIRERAEARRLEIVDLNNEIRLQAQVLENLNAQVMKYRLLISIFAMQLIILGQQPIVPADSIDGISVDDLRNIATSMSHNINRREQLEDK